MGPNLNPWYAVAFRLLNQWSRRQYFKLNKPARMRLWRERMQLAHAAQTDEEMARLRAINWMLGDGSPYRFTSEQIAHREKIVDRIIAEMKADGTW